MAQNLLCIPPTRGKSRNLVQILHSTFVKISILSDRFPYFSLNLNPTYLKRIYPIKFRCLCYLLCTRNAPKLKSHISLDIMPSALRDALPIILLSVGTLLIFLGYFTNSFVSESVLHSVNNRDPSRIGPYDGYYG